MMGASTGSSEVIQIFSAHFGVPTPRFGSADPTGHGQISAASGLLKRLDPWTKTAFPRRFLVPVEAAHHANNQVRLAELTQDNRNRSTWIMDALREVDEIDQTVKEDSLPEIAPETKARVSNLLRTIALRGTRTAPVVYPTEAGEVAVYFNSRPMSCAILIEIGNDGRGSFVCVTDKEEDRCAYYCDSSNLSHNILLWNWLDRLDLRC